MADQNKHLRDSEREKWEVRAKEREDQRIKERLESGEPRMHVLGDRYV